MVMEAPPFIGIQNTGSFCYVISIVQQFFMMVDFRHEILIMNLHPRGKFISELQFLFTALDSLQHSHCDPSTLLDTLFESKCHDGSIFWESGDDQQHDVAEFLARLLCCIKEDIDPVEAGQPLILKFRGEFSHKLSADGGRRAERKEYFHHVSLDVQSVSSLEESLHKLISEVVLDFTWKDSLVGADMKSLGPMPTAKALSFSSLPRHLIFHLKRFDFDFDTMTTKKMNDLFEFPQTLDMAPFMCDSELGVICESPRNYALSGFVIHKGTATDGHFYSIALDRKSGRWIKMNDQKVEYFDVDRIPEVAFGGKLYSQPATVGDEALPVAQTKPKRKFRWKSENAVILFYEQVCGSP